MHLIVDSAAENVALMTSKPLMREFLREAVAEAGMTPFGGAYIQGFPWPGSADWTALTAFQPMMESGLSVHCWPERKFVFIDLFSCAEFDVERVVVYITRAFRLTAPTKVIVLERGIGKNGEIIPASVRQV